MKNIPLPPQAQDNKPSGRLTDDESSFILDATLRADARKDETTLSFIEAFLISKNVAQASREVGIHPSLGRRIRARTDVSNAIQKIIDKSAVKYGFDASEIMERTKEIVDFDPIDLQNPDGSFKSNLHDIPPEARRNLKKLKAKNIYSTVKDLNGMESRIITGEVIEYEFYDKMKAIDLAGKEKEMFKTTTRVEHDITKDMATILLESARRGQQASIQFSAKPVVETTAEVVDRDDT
jgi:hypothetical protein